MENGKLMEKVRAILSLIVPLFVSAFQRAEDLAYAMEARGYIPNRPRSRYKPVSYTHLDVYKRQMYYYGMYYMEIKSRCDCICGR